MMQQVKSWCGILTKKPFHFAVQQCYYRCKVDDKKNNQDTFMLIKPDTSCLLVVDIQGKLVPAVYESEQMINNCRWLIEVAKELQIPILTSEQYPQGLGHTIDSLKAILPSDTLMEKVYFSCATESQCRAMIQPYSQVIIIGMESHVCVLQTALELKQQNHEVFVVADCVSSRSPQDKELALARFRQNGVEVVSREMVAFEWMQKAATDSFRHISKNYLR